MLRTTSAWVMLLVELVSALDPGINGDEMSTEGLTHPPATTPGALLQCNLNLLSRVSRVCGVSWSIGVARLVTLDIVAARSVGKMILRSMVKVVDYEQSKRWSYRLDIHTRSTN